MSERGLQTTRDGKRSGNAVRRAVRRSVVGMLLAGTSALVGTVAGCSSHSGVEDGRFEDDQVNYDVGAPGEGWKDIPIKTGNAAWLQEATQATLLVNSHCEGVDDAPLAALTRHLTFGMTDRQVLSEKPITLSRREALETVLTAKLDGVPRKMKILVLKKDGCVYDVVFASPLDAFDAALPAYDRVKAGLDVHARPDADGAQG